MTRTVLLSLLLIGTSLASYCFDPAVNDNGPCLNGMCPLTGTTCVFPDGICCNDAAIMPDTTTTTTTTTAATTTTTTPSTTTTTTATPAPGVTTTTGPSTTTTTSVPTTTTTAAFTTATTVPTGCSDLIPVTAAENCAFYSYLCNNPSYYSIMTTNCPATCNRCGVTVTSTPVAPSACVDLLNPVTGVSDCPARASYCQNAVYYTLMTEQCAKTCNRCTTSCVDLLNPSTGVSDCPSRASLCNNSVYYNLMTEQCPKTCNRCGVTTTTVAPTRCVDKVGSNGMSNCASMKSYCNDAVYYTLMTDQCPKTCNRC